MKALPVLTAAVVATLLAAMPDASATIIRPDLDADTRARLELIERMRASRGIRYFNTTAPTPAPVVVNAPAVYLPPPVAPKPAAPAPSGNCTPATSAAPVAPPAPPAGQSVSYVEQVTPATASSGPARSLMSRVSASVASRARSAQVLAPLFDARSLRLYGPAAGTAATIKVTPYVTPAAAPAPAPAAAPCVAAEPPSQAAAKPDTQSNPPAGAQGGPSEPGDDNPFLDPELLPGFAGNGPGPGPGPGPEQPGTNDEPESQFLTSLVNAGGGEEGAGGEGGAGGEFQPLAVSPQSVPEPGSLALLGLGLLGLGWARRRRH